MNEMFEIIIKLLGTLAGVGVVYAIKMCVSYLRSRLDESEKAYIDKSFENGMYVEGFIESFVVAAEQMYWNESGEFRLAYVQDRLLEAGYELTDALRAMIESKVYKIHEKVNNGE